VCGDGQTASSFSNQAAGFSVMGTSWPRWILYHFSAGEKGSGVTVIARESGHAHCRSPLASDEGERKKEGR